MKKLGLYVGILLLSYNTSAQVNEETVTIGQGYQNQAFYSLANGEISQNDKNNWDLAFEAYSFGAGIRINDAKGLKLWRYPNADNSAFGTSLDTTGISNWSQLINSDEFWEIGAFNKTANPNNQFDLGWGTYNTTTHVITGDSLFILEKSNGDLIQIDIQNISSGAFNFRYADLDGQNIENNAVLKSEFSGKIFGYFNLDSGQTLDLEPLSSKWELLFTSYVTYLGPNMPYGVTGVLSNAGVEVAKVENVANTTTFNDWSSSIFKEEINTIGYNWKSLNYQTFQFEVDDSLVYFVKSKQDEIWKIVFTGFGGSANGNYEFTTELMSTASLSNHKKNDTKFTVYPNPVQSENITIVYDLPSNENAELFITDISGKIVHREAFNAIEGLTTKQIQLANLKPGIYMVNLKLNNGVLTQKLIKQ